MHLTPALPLLSQILGVMASLITIFYSYRFAHKVLNCDPVFALIPCLILAVSGPFAAWAASGMETNFFGMLIIIGCYYFVSFWVNRSRRNLFLAYGILFPATLTRPEGFLIFLIFLGMTIYLYTKQPGKLRKILLPPIVVYIIPFSLYIIWRVMYYGYLFPNTFYAKTGFTVFLWLRGMLYCAHFFFYFVLPLFLPLLMLMRKTGYLNKFRLKQFMTDKAHVCKYTGAYMPGIIVAVYTLYIIFVGGDYMAMYRFFVPILPFICILYGLVINRLFFIISGSIKKRNIVFALLVLAIIFTGLQSTPLETVLFPKPSMHHGHYRGIQTERWHSARLTLIGKFFNQYKNSPNESIATGAIGAISYYSNMKIYGLHGLVDTHIAHKKMKNKTIGRGLPGHEKEDILYTLSKKPTYFIFSRELTPEPGGLPEFKGDVDKIMRDSYEIKSVQLTDAKNNEEGYFNFLQLRKPNL